MLLHLSYLQAFEDVNKRTARLSCNMPFIKHNLCPLSFADLPKDDYTAALLIVYETLTSARCWTCFAGPTCVLAG
jgi:Fic family protein